MATILDNTRLADLYLNRFDVIQAETLDHKAQSHHLRYQVYCVENRFEDPCDHPEQLEIDQYDRHAVHSLLIDKVSNKSIGTVRIILPKKQDPEHSFPIQAVCPQTLSFHSLIREGRIAEVSRFALTRTCRQSIDESCSSREDLVVQRTLVSHLSLGLIRAVIQMCSDQGITDWFALMEPSLLRLLARFGIYFRPIGSLVEHHGSRQPCAVNIAQLLGRVRNERPDVWELITDDGNFLDAAVSRKAALAGRA